MKKQTSSSIFLQKKHRPTFEKLHAPYRGVTARTDVVNGFLALTHDLVYVKNKLGLNPNQAGLIQQSTDNFSFLLQGEGTQVTSKHPSAGNYVTCEKDEKLSQNLMESVWTTSPGVVKTINGKAVQLTSDGLLDPTFIAQSFEVKSGDAFYFRLKLTLKKGKGDTLFLGAKDLNGQIKEGVFLKLEKNQPTFVDTKIFCQQDEMISFVLYLSDTPEKLEETIVLVEECLLTRLSQATCALPGLEKDLRKEVKQISYQMEKLQRK